MEKRVAGVMEKFVLKLLVILQCNGESKMLGMKHRHSIKYLICVSNPVRQTYVPFVLLDCTILFAVPTDGDQMALRGATFAVERLRCLPAILLALYFYFYLRND